MPTAGPPPAGRPLAGWNVVVTRSRSQASGLVEALRAAGAVPVELPVIEIAGPEDEGAALEAASAALVSGAYQWVALTSANAVIRLMEAVGDHRVPDEVRWAAVGPATARALRGAGYAPDLVPTDSVSNALAEAFPEAIPEAPGVGGSVLYPRAETVRGALADGLRSKGWTVDEVVAYRTVGAEPDPGRVADARRADAVVFTSSSTVRRTLDLVGARALPPVVVTIGPVTSEAVRAAGLRVAAEAAEPTVNGMVTAVVTAIDAHRSAIGQQ